MPLHRVFIAFPVSNEAKEDLERIQNELKSLNCENRISWSKPEGMHITLEFLGEITTDFITQISQILGETAKRYKPFKFKLDKIDAFPNKHNPRVIVVKVRDETGESYRLQKELRNKLQALNLKLDDKNWSPHITLGRIKNDVGTGPSTSAGRLDLSVIVKNVEWVDDRIELIESELRPEGPRYKILKNFSLQN